MTVAALRPESMPYNAEAEQAVLGVMILNPDLAGYAVRMGGAQLFHDPTHAAIFDAIAKRERANMLVSVVALKEAMGDVLDEVGGPGYLARLAAASPAPSSFRGYVDMLADLNRKRGIVSAITEAQAAVARGERAGDIAARLEAALVAASIESGGEGPVSMKAATVKAMQQIHAAYVGEDDGSVKTGIHALDQKLGGLYPGELILLGGRPSMGKTGVALSIALNAARAGHGVAIASLEMNPEAMAIRALSEGTSHTGTAVSYAQMRRGDMADFHVDALRKSAAVVADLPITFLPRQFSDLGALFAGAKQVKRMMGDQLRLMVIDYAQLLRAQGKSRYEQITEISIALKALAGQLNVPVIALSQLSRAVEQREDKRPQLSDLRESGQLEQDADTVLFCYRDEYYVERMRPALDAPVDEHEAWRAAMESARNRLEVIVAKQRQGEIGTAHMRFNPALNLIWED